MRYSSAALTALVLSFFTFLGMTLLITTNTYKKSESFESIEFSKINDMDKIEPIQPSPPRTLPKQEQVKTPPAAPKIDMTETPDPNPGTRIPTGIGKPELTELTNLAKPNVMPTGDKPGLNQGLIALLSVMPNYPVKEQRNKVEGWVTVEFIVNELGNATQIKVIDSQPKRVFDQATIRAIRKSKFKPLRIDGKAVSQTAIQTIEFKIE